MSDIKLSECLFDDLQTDEQRRDWFSLGRGVETGVIAPALQAHLTIAYHKIVESKKLIEQQQQQIAELEEQLNIQTKRGDLSSPAMHIACDFKELHDKVCKERDELAATVERLRDVCRLGIDTLVFNDIDLIQTTETMRDAIETTPQQNLNAVKQQAVDEYKRSITEPNVIVHRYPVVDLSGSYLPGANGRATMMFGHIENAESSSPKAFIKCVIGRLLELLDDFNSNDCSTVKMPHVDTKKSAIEVAFTDGYTAGNGYPPSQWEVDQYMQSVKDGE